MFMLSDEVAGGEAYLSEGATVTSCTARSAGGGCVGPLLGNWSVEDATISNSSAGSGGGGGVVHYDGSSSTYSNAQIARCSG
jgi:hypothetical protein